MNSKYIPLIKLSGWAALLQFLCIPATIAVTFLLGPPIHSALDFFQNYEINPLATLIRDDGVNLLLISLSILSFPGVFLLCKEKKFTPSILALGGVIIAAILAMASHKGFALADLYQSYSQTTDPELHRIYLAVAQGLVSDNMWNSSASFFCGILLQGGGILIGFAMMGNSTFRRITVISAIGANALDLGNHLIHYSAPVHAQWLIYLAGPLYITWYLFMTLDLFRWIKNHAAPTRATKEEE